MIGRWSNWKPFPDPQRGGHVDAPIGPGVYEVCHVVTQEQVAFGYAANVAQALCNLLPPPDTGTKWSLFRRSARLRYHHSELEYRTCATASVEQARIAAEQLMGHRQALWRRLAPAVRQI